VRRLKEELERQLVILDLTQPRGSGGFKLSSGLTGLTR
jgi:hypothetical protein